MPNLPGFFGRCCASISDNVGTQSGTHSNVQVTNSIIQIITASVESYTPSVVIPGTVAQCLASSYAIFHSDVYMSERLLHVFQGLTAAARFSLAVVLMFERETCEPSSDVSSQSNHCIAAFLLMLIYSGTVSLGLAVSALSKNGVMPPPVPDSVKEERESLNRLR